MDICFMSTSTESDVLSPAHNALCCGRRHPLKAIGIDQAHVSVYSEADMK